MRDDGLHVRSRELHVSRALATAGNAGLDKHVGNDEGAKDKISRRTDTARKPNGWEEIVEHDCTTRSAKIGS
jgi:hypothetical protein